MIFGIGVDVLRQDRMSALHEKFGDRLAARILMPAEIAQFEKAKRPLRFLAMRFAAKEAIVKAMGTGFAQGVWVRDVGIVQNPAGKPEVVYSPRGDAVRRRARRGRRTRHADGRSRAHRRGGRARTRGDGLKGARVHQLVFDIETIPDVDFGRRLLGLEGLDDAAVADAMFMAQRQRTGNDFLPLPQQRVIAIACALRTRDGVKVWSLGDPAAGERELLERFFDGIERYTPDLVSWNGAGFDLPVMHYRSLLHGLSAPRYWEHGDEDNAFRYNNYLSRYHWRHLDLMDVLSGFQGRGRAALADMACLLGFPGKLGFEGSKVWPAWQEGDIVGIRRYCETDVLNTYLVLLHFERLRGLLSNDALAAEQQRLRAMLGASDEPHHREFLDAWPDPAR